MRTLSAELTSAQQAEATKPYHDVEFFPRNGGTSYSYKTSDATNRLIFARTAEEMYGGSLFDMVLPDGRQVPIAAQIWMQNSSDEFTAKDFRGHKVVIKRGFSSYVNTTTETSITGTKTSQGQPYFVIMQRDHGTTFRKVTEFLCLDAWGMLKLRAAVGNSLAAGVYKSEGKIFRSILFDTLTENPLYITSFNATGSVYDNIEDNLLAHNGLYDTGFVSGVGDILYIGVSNTDLAEFDRITIEAFTQATADATVIWEYSQGASAWAALADVVDNTAGLTDTQDANNVEVPKVVSFTHPSAWAADTVNSRSARWVRMRVTAVTTGNDATLTRIGVGKHWGFNITTSDAQENAAILEPDFAASADLTEYSLLRQILDRLSMAVVMTELTFDFRKLETTPASTYTYDYTGGTHKYFTNYRDRTLVIPNRVIAMNQIPGGFATQYTSDDYDDAVSRDAVGVMPYFVIDKNIPSKAEANLRAERVRNKFQVEAFQGEVLVPINIGQEPWDNITVVDDRITVTYTGRVGRILNIWDTRDGTYRSSITLGIRKNTDFPARNLTAGTLSPLTGITNVQGLGAFQSNPVGVGGSSTVNPGNSGLYGALSTDSLNNRTVSAQEEINQRIQEAQRLTDRERADAQTRLKKALERSGIGSDSITRIDPVRVTDDSLGNGISGGGVIAPTPIPIHIPLPPSPPAQVLPPLAGPPITIIQAPPTFTPPTTPPVQIIQLPPISIVTPPPATIILPPGAGYSPPTPTAPIAPTPPPRTGLPYGFFAPGGGAPTGEEEEGITSIEKQQGVYESSVDNQLNSIGSRTEVFDDITTDSFRFRHSGYETVIMYGTNLGGAGITVLETVNNTSSVDNAWFHLKNYHTLLLSAASGLITFGDDNSTPASYRFVMNALDTLGPSTEGAILGDDNVSTGPKAWGKLYMAEVAEPASPSNVDGVLFLKDDGAGKTQLCIRFASGSSIVLATEV